VKLGVHVGYWGLDLMKGGQGDLVAGIEGLGFDSLWVAEAYGSDAPSVLGALAVTTQRIALGASILQVPARTATATAMTAASIDRLSGGRFRLGLGLSSNQVSEGWYGQPFDRPLARLEDYVAVVRTVLRRERLEYSGKTLQLPLPGGPGKPLKLLIEPVQARLPIYLAAVGPQALRLTGRIADGWLGAFFCPEHADALLADVRAGAADAGRDMTGFEVTPTVSLWIDDDPTAARNRMRHSLALYVGGMGSRSHNVYANLVRHYGFEAAAAEVQDLYLEGRKEEAAAALPEKLIDLVTLCGQPAQVRDRLAAYASAGVTTVILSPATTRLDQFLDQLRRVAALM